MDNLTSWPIGGTEDCLVLLEKWNGIYIISAEFCHAFRKGGVITLMAIAADLLNMREHAGAAWSHKISQHPSCWHIHFAN